MLMRRGSASTVSTRHWTFDGVLAPWAALDRGYYPEGRRRRRGSLAGKSLLIKALQGEANCLRRKFD